MPIARVEGVPRGTRKACARRLQRSPDWPACRLSTYQIQWPRPSGLVLLLQGTLAKGLTALDRTMKSSLLRDWTGLRDWVKIYPDVEQRLNAACEDVKAGWFKEACFQLRWLPLDDWCDCCQSINAKPMAAEQ